MTIFEYFRIASLAIFAGTIQKYSKINSEISMDLLIITQKLLKTYSIIRIMTLLKPQFMQL